MSHYTSIKTKYTNPGILKKVINKLGHPYVAHNSDKNIEIPMNFSKTLKSRIYDNSNEIELNYGYSETITQALELGFTRSKVLTTNKQNNRFVFQRYVEVKR